MPLSDVLVRRAPVLAAYEGQRQANEMRGPQELQQALTLSGLIEQQRMRQMQAQEAQRKAAQQMEYRAALQAAGDDPEKQVAVARRYGDPKDVLNYAQGSLDRRAQMQQRLVEQQQALQAKKEQAEQALAAKMELAQQAGADRRTLMEMQLQGRKEIAGMMAAVQRESIAARRDAMAQGNKPPAGYRYKPDGSLEAIPGGPADQKLQQAGTGRETVNSLIATLRDQYSQLHQGGGIADPKAGVMSNLAAGIGSSGVGQFAGRMVGTQNQSLRNQISQQRPLLLNAIKQATGMTAKQMDSNVELKMYLAAATDPTLDIRANLAALDKLDELYGLSGKTATPPASGSNNPRVVDW